MSYCLDCGTKLRSSGACPNCQEETVIFDEQFEEDPFPLSKEFKDKIQEQKPQIKRNKERIKAEGNAHEGAV